MRTFSPLVIGLKIDLARASRTGLSLLELMIVLIIMATVAGLVVPLSPWRISTPTGEKSPEQITTETSMHAIREAIVGTSDQPGAWLDLVRRPQHFITDPADFQLNLVELQIKYAESGRFREVRPYDPVTRIGWRGPYLSPGKSLVDAWGQPFELQVIDWNRNGIFDAEEIRYARLVSGGPDENIDTPVGLDDMIPGDDPNLHLTHIECHDDLVLFLFVTDSRGGSPAP